MLVFAGILSEGHGLTIKQKIWPKNFFGNEFSIFFDRASLEVNIS